MNLFETVKSAFTVKQAAEHYGYEVNRGDRSEEHTSELQSRE